MKKRGYNFIEVLIGLAILAIILTGFMLALDTGILGTHRNTQENTALHLAQSQMEYTKSHPFISQSPYNYSTVPVEDLPPGFNTNDIQIVASNVSGISMAEIQLIMVTVTYDENSAVHLVGYKTNTFSAFQIAD